MNKTISTGHNIYPPRPQKYIVDILSVRLTLSLEANFWMLHITHRLAMMNICAKLFQYAWMDEKILDWKIPSFRQRWHFISKIDLEGRSDYGEDKLFKIPQRHGKAMDRTHNINRNILLLSPIMTLDWKQVYGFHMIRCMIIVNNCTKSFQIVLMDLNVQERTPNIP